MVWWLGESTSTAVVRRLQSISLRDLRRIERRLDDSACQVIELGTIRSVDGLRTKQLGVAHDCAEGVDHVMANRRREMTKLDELLRVIRAPCISTGHDGASL